MISVLAECHWSGTWMLCLPCEQFHCSTCSWKASEKFRSCTFQMLRSKNRCQEPSRIDAKNTALWRRFMRRSCLQTWLGNRLGVCQAFSPRRMLLEGLPLLRRPSLWVAELVQTNCYQRGQRPSTNFPGTSATYQLHHPKAEDQSEQIFPP